MEPNITPPAVGGEVNGTAENVKQEKTTRFRIGIFGFFLFLVFVVGLFWMFTTPNMTVGLTLSFVAGLSMIFLPCTLPLAFVIVPLTMGKDPKKGLFMALFFTLGLTITLSFYGVFIAAVGKSFGLKSDAEVYAVLLGGIAAFLFGLSEIGLLKFKLPSYSGKFPDFIQRRKDYMKTFLLGLLLGNAGVGCPNPAFYILLGYIATTGDLFNGWFLGFVHGLGRSVPLIFLAILGTLGVNALSGVAKHKEGVERVMGWMLVIIGAYLLTFGIFGHDWFIASGVHSSWEQFVVNIGGERFGETILKHEHVLINIPNFIQYGNKFFLGLLALTFLAAFAVKRPSKRTILWLSAVYLAIVLVIGYSTGWTFKTATGHNVHVEFQESSTAPHGEMMEEGRASAYYEEKDVASGLAVDFAISPAPVFTGVQERLNFFVNIRSKNLPVENPVSISDLEIDLEKIMHVIGVRGDLNEFFHIHPDQTYQEVTQGSGKTAQIFLEEIPGLLATDHIFSKPGIYKIWSEITKDGVDYVFGHEKFSVEGYGPREEKEMDLSRVKTINGYQVTFGAEKVLVKGKNLALSLDIHDSAGNEVELENYLGVPAHFTIIKEDLKQLIHAHPVRDGNHRSWYKDSKTLVSLKNLMIKPQISNGAHPMGHGDEHARYQFFPEALAHGGEVDEHSEEEGMDMSMMMGGHGTNFQVVFPEAGLYKAFAQFRPQGAGLAEDETLTAAFWLQVEEKKPLPLSPWWINLIWSAAAIIILGWIVKKYLKTA